MSRSIVSIICEVKLSTRLCNAFCRLQMSVRVSKEIKTPKGITVSFNAMTTKKSPLANVLFECQTSTPNILTQLLRMFAEVKHLSCCTNANTCIIDVKPGYCSLAFVCPDNKVLPTLVILYNFLYKTKIPPQLSKCVDFTKESYAKHHQALTKFSVSIFGKCKSTVGQLSTNGKKVQQFINSVDAVYEKFHKSDYEGDKHLLKPLNTKTFATSDIPNLSLMSLYTCIVLGDVPSTVKIDIKNITVTFLDPCETHWCNINKNFFQDKVKTFLTQFGAPGSQSASDPKGDKYKVKCKEIIDSLNAAAYQLAKLHNAPCHTFKTVDEVKAVDKALVGILKHMKEN